jgi:hypothetical protein
MAAQRRAERTSARPVAVAAIGLAATAIAALVRAAISPRVELTAQGVAYDRVFGGSGEWLHTKVFSLLHTLGLPFELGALESANLAISSLAVGALAACALVLLRDARRAAIAALLGILHADALAYATTLAEAPLVSLLVPVVATSLFALALRPSLPLAVAFVCATVPLSASRMEAFALVAVMGAAAAVFPTARRPLVAAAVIVATAFGAAWSASALGIPWLAALVGRSLRNLRPDVWSIVRAVVLYLAFTRARRSRRLGPFIETWLGRLRSFFSPVLGDGTPHGRLPLFLGLAWAGCVLVEVTHNRDNLAMPHARYMLGASPLLFLFVAAALPRFDPADADTVARRSGIGGWLTSLRPLHGLILALFVANEARSAARLPVRFNDQEELRFARTLLPMLRPDDVMAAIQHADLGDADDTAVGAKPRAIFGPHVACVVPVNGLSAFVDASGKPTRRIHLFLGIDAVAQTSDRVVPSVAEALSRCVWRVEAEREIPNRPFDLNALDYESLGHVEGYRIRAEGIENLAGARHTLTLRLLELESCR